MKYKKKGIPSTRIANLLMIFISSYFRNLASALFALYVLHCIVCAVIVTCSIYGLLPGIPSPNKVDCQEKSNVLAVVFSFRQLGFRSKIQWFIFLMH
ncbi:putative ATP-dependent RNA helicase spindle-E [Gossypium arboreum]|uniref:Putative ATP-dependent RNA helicase spindle-E n=1 Tax=Gossypium arboreum TaxID=29729 RepID=A0A0B0N6K2_GOSAR|nr:putative ATP-dependent RNA helicase spindle-E [Gossypium arboreum]